MDYIEIIGFAAAILTTAAFIPQDINVIKNHHTHDISLFMYIIITIGFAAWFAYGYMQGSYPIMFAYFFSFIFAAIILVYKIKYK
jgi:MtN3 and saliva related transmembrane protein